MTLEAALAEYRRLSEGYVDQHGVVDGKRMMGSDMERFTRFMAVRNSIAACVNSFKTEVPNEWLAVLRA
jgi:hypothetical protein